MPNNINIWLVLLHVGLCSTSWNFGCKPETLACIEEAILEVRKVKVTPSEQLCLEKVLTPSGAKYLVHVHGHQALHFSRRGHHSRCGCFVHRKNSYQGGLVSSEAFVGAWQKNPFKYAHMDLDLDCLPALTSGLDARPL